MTRGVLVAGGQGRRLGQDVPKALVTLGPGTLLDRALRTLLALADEVVVAAPESLELPRMDAEARVRRAIDRPPGGGPLAGVVAALDDGGFDRAVVLGVDFPFLSASALRAIVGRLDETPQPTAVVPAPGGRLQPLAAAYAPAGARALEAAFEAGERSIVRAVGRLEPRVLQDIELEAIAGGLDAFFNLNTPEDLLEAERRIAADVRRP
jgi:molybdopterin-guanine dinucleotide biosynthesis protein A